MNKVTVVTDSVACLTKEQASQYGIEIIPISFFAGGKIYHDWVDVSPTEAYKLFLQAPDSFHTSAPSPQDCLQVFRKAVAKASSILCITVSSKLSRLFDSAAAAKGLAKEEFAGNILEILDSKQATSSEGMIVLAAARAATGGKGMAEVKQEAEDVREKIHAIAFLDTIEHVYRSGRVPKIASQVGSKLKIKPILTVSEVVHFAGLVRTRKKGIERMLEMMREKVDSRPIRVSITHAYAPEDAEFLKERISTEFNCLEIWLSEFSPVMGYACGTGTLGVAFYEE